MEFIPRDYQREAIEFILQHKVCGILLDIRMGKTVIALTAMQKLLHDYFQESQILVITSKVLVQNVWIKELGKWDHLHKLKYSVVMGMEKERYAAINKKVDIYFINMENIGWLLRNNLWEFDTLILDEFYRCKNEKSNYFKDLLVLRSRVKRIIGLSAMPVANGLSDIWALCFLLDGGERLGRSKQGFCERYFFSEWRLVDRKYKLCREAKRGAKEAIYNAIKDIFYCRETDDLSSPCVYRDYCIEMSPSEYSKYFWLENNVLYPVDSAETCNFLENMSKLLQAANGFWTDNLIGKYIFHERKLAALNQMVRAADGKRFLIAYLFSQDKEQLLKQYPDAVLLDSRIRVEQWNRGEGKIAIIHPASNEAQMQLNEGTDVLIWYSLPWSYEVYKKLNGHILEDKKTKAVVHIIMMGTIEEKLLLLLKKKDRPGGYDYIPV